MTSDNHGIMKWLFFTFMSLMLLIVSVTYLPGRLPAEIVRENGPIETLSAGGYFLFCLFILYFNFLKIIETTIAPFVFTLLLGLRELDFHARFSTMGIFKSRYYLSSEVPVMEKSIAALFVIGLIIFTIVHLRRLLPEFKKDFLQRKPYAITVITALCCVVFSKFLDGNADLFEAIFLNIVETPVILSRIIEECVELFIPVLLIKALLLYCEDQIRLARKDRAL